MKKLSFIFIFTVIVCMLAVGVGAGVAFAAVSEPECDEVFKTTLEELLTTENAEDTYFASSKKILYDLDMESLGYIYAFTANGIPGFAIVINSYGIYECVEIYFDATNPYSSATEDDVCIYVNLLTYWLYRDGVYYDVLKNEDVPNLVVENAREKAYFSTTSSTPAVAEYIYFTYRSEVNHRMVNRHPELITNVSSCVPTMGANIIQFYDRYSENLIPNYVPGTTIQTIYRYKRTSDETNQVVLQLASDMGTTSTGTTISKFSVGMNKYCNDRGYSFSSTSCMSNGQFNYSLAKQQINSGKPIALFVDPYTIETICVYDDRDFDIIEHWYSDVPHSMAMFGYREITYTLNNGQTRKDDYLQIATGNIFYSSGYCKIGGGTVIDQALAISIS